ncbi:hypothetical protein FEM33_11345 [Dyadobacter flavalbus]|uniref:Uncharacterized protein n=1 Tax=Dyadobacter flavalbus TaxID=2579942 RepID=A0A5M8QWG2_9BACT|nr:hypothetical protein [Dyadobacter flavalbus]KAA6439691.1 hypothetical protein FEM33_11345 [Dyadobacter flavalbus]
MNFESYDTQYKDYNAFQFYSEGDKTYNMLMALQPLRRPRSYNLAFGVWDEKTNKIDDKIELKNGDSDKILATVAQKTLEFLQKYPDSNIFATGSAEPGELRVRTRRYQIGINNNYEFLSEKHNIYALIADKDEKGNFYGNWPAWEGRWEPFQKGTNYDGFLLNLKR